MVPAHHVLHPLPGVANDPNNPSHSLCPQPTAKSEFGAQEGHEIKGLVLLSRRRPTPVMHSYEYRLLCDFDETQEAAGTRLVLFFCYSNHGRLPKHALTQKVKMQCVQSGGCTVRVSLTPSLGS